MERRIVNFFRPGKILSIRFVDEICVAKVDFGAIVAIILEPYQGEQVGDFIVTVDGVTFIPIPEGEAAKRISEMDLFITGILVNRFSSKVDP